MTRYKKKRIKNAYYTVSAGVFGKITLPGFVAAFKIRFSANLNLSYYETASEKVC